MKDKDKSKEELLQELQKLRKDYETLSFLYHQELKECRKNESDLSFYKDRFELIMMAANFAWWKMDIPTGNIIFSERKAEMLGYQPEKFNHYKDFMALVHPNDYDKTMKAMMDHFKGISDKYDTIYRILSNSGEYKYFHDIGKITHRDSFGKPLTVTGIVIEIFDKSSLVDAVKENEQRFRYMISKHESIMLLIEPVSGKIIDSNQSASDFYQYSIEELRNMSIYDLNVLNTEQISIERNKALNEEQKIFIFPHKIANGEIRIVEVHSSPIELNNQKLLFSIIHDITERIKIEGELKKSEEYLRKGEEIGKTGHWLLYLNENLMISSDGANKIYGLNKNENNYEQIRRMPLAEYRPKLDKALSDTIKNGKTFSFEYKIKRETDGKIIDIHSFAEFDKEKNILFGTIQDITERKKAEEALKMSESKFKNLVRDMPVGVLLQTPGAEILLCNQKSLELLGITEDQLLGKTSFDPDWNVIHEDGSPFPGNTHPVPMAISSKQAVKSIVMGVYHPLNKERAWLLVDAIPQMNDKGEVIQVVCTFIDITKRIKAEEALRESEEKYRSMFENIQDVYYEANLDGVILEASPSISVITKGQYCREDLIGKNLKDLYANIDERTEFYKAIEEKASVTDFEVKLINKDETFINSSISSKIQFDSNNRPIKIIGSMRDITERKKTEMQNQLLIEQINTALQDFEWKNWELIKVKDELENSIKEKDRFFSIIAHDLRSPFTGFLGLTKLMAENIEDFTLKEMNEMSKSMQDSASNLFALLENLLEWSRMQRGVIQFNPEICRLDYLVKQNIDIAHEFAKQKNIDLINNISENIQVTADIPMLNTVFRNLISNAIKFTKRDGKIEIGSEIKPSEDLEHSESYIIIYIKDNGIGMNHDIISKLFKVDEKISRPGTEGESSTGLGLLLCKDFIEKNGGKIWVESEVGKGSTFYFSLQEAK